MPTQDEIRLKAATYQRKYREAHPELREYGRKYKAIWLWLRRQDPAYLAKDRALKAEAMRRFRAKRKAGA